MKTKPSLCRLLSALAIVVSLAGCASRSVPPEQVAAAAKSLVPATFAERMEQGDTAFRSNDSDKALFMYMQAAQLDEKADLPLLRMAAIEEARGHLAQTRQLLEQALQRVPANAAAHERLGYVLLRGGEPTSAEKEFAAAFRLDPKRWRSVAGLGLVAMQLDDLPLARGQFDAALTLQPDSPELLSYSADQYLRSNRLDLGLRDARASLIKAPSASTQLILGDLLARKSDYAGALEAYLVALNEPAAYERLAEECMRVSEFTRAIRYFQQAANASPTFNERINKRLAVARERIAESDLRTARGG